MNATTRARSRAALVAALYLVVGAFTLQTFLAHWGTVLANELDSTLALATPRPYAYRVLTPLAVRGAAALIPRRLAPALVDNWGRGIAGLTAMHECAPPATLPFLVAVWWMLAALWGTALVWRGIVRWALPERTLLVDAVPALGLLALPATFTGAGFLYDFPELFFVSACFLALVRRRWAAWYALLPLAVLNKEASVLALAWWLAVRDAMPRRAWWTHAALSAATGGAVLASLWWAFRRSVGYVAQVHLAGNVAYWLSLRWLFATQDTFGLGLPFPVSLHLVDAVLLWGTWSLGRTRVPPAARRALGWSLAAVGPPFLLFGFENEIRVFAVAAPPLIAVAAGALDRLYDGAPPSAGHA